MIVWVVLILIHFGVAIATISSHRYPLNVTENSELQVRVTDVSTGSDSVLILSSSVLFLDRHRRLDVFRSLVPSAGPVVFENVDGRINLILGSTAADFASICVSEDSIVRVHFSVGRSIDMRVRSQIPGLVVQRRYWVDFRVNHIGGFPDIVYDSIVQRLRFLGVTTPDHDDIIMEFGNCGTEEISQLPDIEFSFVNGGRIVITPQDYMSWDPVQSICSVKVQRCVENSISGCSFNPLALRDMNIRITTDTIEFCDSV